MNQRACHAIVLTLALSAMNSAVLAQDSIGSQQTPRQFGGSYADLDARRRALVDDWVTRFNQVTGQKASPATFYDSQIRLSAKTTFDAVTNALMTTPLTDESSQRFGDALDIVDRVDMVRGHIDGASGDRQFRMYVQLKPDAVTMLERSREFRRGTDNTVFHKGYPINYRQQGGAPSMQISMATDHRRADIDVDYRASSFPAAMFNGHLTAANSDVRAGNNFDRHVNRWAGFQNWWRSFFGIRIGGSSAGDDNADRALVPDRPRAGDKTIDLMMEDFLKAWLVDGDITAAMSYVSEQALSCLIEDSDDPQTFDRGTAPFLLYANLKAAHEALGTRSSLEGLTVGMRLRIPGVKLVTQANHARYVIYWVPDDVAARFDCESRLSLKGAAGASRVYGNYFGATFYIDGGGGKDYSIALLWARNSGYWKIVSWHTDPESDDIPEIPRPPEVKIARVKADASLVEATRTFLETWLIRKNYDEAFRYLSPESYACYNLARNPDEPVAGSTEEAGRRVRASLERGGNSVGSRRTLDEVIEGVQASHPGIRVMDHRASRTYGFSSWPDAFAAAANCAARARRDRVKTDVPLVYGKAFGMNIRIRMRAGEPPVLRTLWMKEAEAWRIVAYDVETP